MERKVREIVMGQNAVDGAGVHLVRVLGKDTMEAFDPFLMLDSFDSRNPADYIKGFPLHPHRGIETITYLAQGEIVHTDSLGNSGVIENGGTQWMTAGSGILHEEMPQAAPRMLGLQVWLNLPQTEKMTEPKYFDIPSSDVITVKSEDYVVRLISGEFAGKQGARPHHLQAAVFHILIEPGKEIKIPTKKGETVFIFSLVGDVKIAGQSYREKSAILFGDGDFIKVGTREGEVAQVMFFQAPPLHEPIAWGGPIVMNTAEELQFAFTELRAGTFIKRS